MCPIFSCRALPRSRKMPATIRPAPSGRWPSGRRKPFASNISKIPGRSSMRNAQRPPGVLRALLLLIMSAGGAFAEGIDKQDFKQIERGRYLTIVGDCAACHTLPGSGYALAGGRAIETPFGV